MQCTRPQAADGLARRRRIDQKMEMERQTQPQQKWIRKTKPDQSAGCGRTGEDHSM